MREIPKALANAIEAIARDPEFIAEMKEADESAAALVEFWAQLRDVDDEYRHDTLAWFARSDWWHPCGMLLLGWQGKLHRDAYRALEADLGADTPGKRWDALPMGVGRDSIIRLLGLTDKSSAFYASTAFKTWVDDDERSWIAGAVGMMPFKDAKKAMVWRHLDIREVILWDPRTNEARLVGEHHSTSFMVQPDRPDVSLTVWGDCRAFFQAWAAARARTGDLIRAAARGKWAHPVNEPADSNLPGALVIGDVARLRWPDVGVETVQAGPGLTPAELHYAAVRAAKLPRFEGFRGGRGD